jgi:hypothetical protein
MDVFSRLKTLSPQAKPAVWIAAGIALDDIRL